MHDQVHADIRQREQQNPTGEYLLQEPGVPGDYRLMSLDKEVYHAMCDEFEQDGVWADAYLLQFAAQVLQMKIVLMPALPNPPPLQPGVSNEFEYEEGLTDAQKKSKCVIAWSNNCHYSQTVPMLEEVCLKNTRFFKTVLFNYDAPLAQDPSSGQFNTDAGFANVHAKSWFAHVTAATGDCLPDTLAASSS